MRICDSSRICFSSFLANKSRYLRDQMTPQTNNDSPRGFTLHSLDGRARALFVVMVIVLLTALFGCKQESRQQATLSSSIDASNVDHLKGMEGSGIYSDGWVGEIASISLVNPQHTRGLSVSGANVVTGMKDETLTLRLQFEGKTSDSVEIKETGRFDEILLLSAQVSRRDTVEFELLASKVFVPAKLGTSQDERRLSFRLNKIAILDPNAVAEKMPSGFEFPHRTENDPNLLGVYKDGWFGDSAVVTLHNFENKSSVEIRGFFPPNVFTKIAVLEIYAGGKLLVKEQLAKKNGGYFRSIVQLPEEQLGAGKTILTIKPSGTFVPAQRGINPDTRRISYQLQYIGLR